MESFNNHNDKGCKNGANMCERYFLLSIAQYLFRFINCRAIDLK